MAIDKNFILGYGAGKASKTNQTIIEETDAWLEENISQETGYVLDRTLMMSNAAAPADLVGKMNGFVTPEQFEAVGNGITDDTQELQDCLDYSFQNKIPVLLTKSYKVTSSLNVHDWCEIHGNKNTNYNIIFTPSDSSDENPAYLFVNTDSSPSLYRHSFIDVTIRKTTGWGVCFANSCPIDYASVVCGCTIHEFNIVFDCLIGHLSHIIRNKFTSVMYAFHTKNLTDSYITGNYISGYRPFAPYCFYGGKITHSEVSGNFFDYWFGVFINCIYAKIINNIFDYCYMVIGFVDDYEQRYIKAGSNIEPSFVSTVIIGNIFPNCSDCNTNNNGFGNVKNTIGSSYNGTFKVNLLEKFPPCAIYVGQIRNDTTNDKLIPKGYYYSFSVSATGNHFFGDGIVICSTNALGIIMEGNSYNVDSVNYNYFEDIPNVYISISNTNSSAQKRRKTSLDILTVLPFRNLPKVSNNSHTVFGAFSLNLNRGDVWYANKKLTCIADSSDNRKFYDALGNEAQ